MPVRVLLADDNALFRHGVAEILKADGRFDVVGQASRGREAIDLALALHPDLVLMDLRMPGMSGAEAIREIRAHDPKMRVAVLTVYETDEAIRTALDAGALGYLLKDATPGELCDAAAALAQGERVAPKVAAKREAEEGQPSGTLTVLTPRELEVLRMLATGARNEAIARRLGITPKTLRNHISNLYHKLHIYDRAQAVIVAINHGVIKVPTQRDSPSGRGLGPPPSSDSGSSL